MVDGVPKFSYFLEPSWGDFVVKSCEGRSAESGWSGRSGRAGHWFPFCVSHTDRFGWCPKWQARTTYRERVRSHAFPMLSHTKQWGLPQRTLSPFQLPTPVHVLALCLAQNTHSQSLNLEIIFICFYCHLLACFIRDSWWKSWGKKYVRLSSPIACFHLKWHDLVKQGREELASACSVRTRTSLSVWSGPLTFLIAAS